MALPVGPLSTMQTRYADGTFCNSFSISIMTTPFFASKTNRLPANP
jgi:hypothetical protein